jgi:hypothetical protein
MLFLHLGKTEYILFGPKRKLKSIIDFQGNYNGHRIKSQSTCSIEYLGIGGFDTTHAARNEHPFFSTITLGRTQLVLLLTF